MREPVKNAAIIVAAGRGARAGDGVAKQYRLLGGKPVLRHSAEALSACPQIDAVLVVIHPDDLSEYTSATSGIELLRPVVGGATRQQSVLNGLLALEEMAPDNVLIHDAARPFLDIGTINSLIDALGANDGAVPALPVVDSLRRGDLYIEGEIDRSGLVRVQTPQAFRFGAILGAHRAAEACATDDVEIARAAGMQVAIVKGAESMSKLTFGEDFDEAERRLAARLVSRTGMGFDVHRFGPGDHVWLCGIRIPHDHGLVGHSDADAGLHALTDALLGAASEGDIGDHFPPSDKKWRGAASDIFLKHAAELITCRGGIIDHVDVTLVCEEPKINIHRSTMRERIATLLRLPLTAVSIKATTTERLGFAGRGEGIAAQAIATVRLPVADATTNSEGLIA